MNRNSLIDKYNTTGKLTGEELEQIARESGNARYVHNNGKHVSVKATNGSGVIFPSKGEIARDVLAEIWKAFRACGIVALLAALVLKLTGVI